MKGWPACIGLLTATLNLGTALADDPSGPPPCSMDMAKAFGMEAMPRGARSRMLSGAENAAREEVNRRAEHLATAFQRVEASLREVGLEPDDFAASNRSWAAVLAGEEIAVAVHERDGDTVTRVDLFGTDALESLMNRLEVAEQALLHTPVDCGTAHGALDASIDGANGPLIYALTLTDRRDTLAWGMHYRFATAGGQLDRVERMHYRCSIGPWAWQPARPDGKPADRRDRLKKFTPLPGIDLPTETYLMQLHLFPDLPYDKHILWTSDKIFTLAKGETKLPRRYHAMANPCAVAGDPLAVEPTVP